MRAVTRPLTYDERLDTKKGVLFTKGQIAEIQKACGPTTDFGTFVREAALSVARGESQIASPGSRPAPLISESVIEKALLSALDRKERENPNIHQVELAPDLNQKLSEVSESAGFVEPGDFIEEVLRVMLRDPAELREMVIGKTIRDLEAVIGSLSESEAPQKRSRKVA